MRDLIVFAIVFGSLPFILRRPAIGVLMFTWISLMNPHRLTYGAAYDFPFAAMIAGVTLIGLLFTKEPRRFPVTSVTVLLIVFMAWMTLTSFFALEPDLAWKEWDRVMKTLFMILIAMIALNNEKDIKAFAWVVGLSLGFYGLKGGIFTLASGGTNRVLGPPGSYIFDNNDLALALVMTVPVIWSLQLLATKKWLRFGLMGLAVLTMAAAAGSYSRGALLAGGAMLFFLWIKSKNKLRTGLLLLMVLPLVYVIMPAKWFDRMDTIKTYQADSSAMGRINSWHFATNVAIDNVMGGGYKVFTRKMFLVYAPDPLAVHAPHSIYFQVLGEQGFIGLGLFVAIMFYAWRTGTRIIKYCKEKPELGWAENLAAMCQVSIIGYAVGGAFLTLAYYDLYYDIVILLVLLEKLLLAKKKTPFSESAKILSNSPRARGLP